MNRLKAHVAAGVALMALTIMPGLAAAQGSCQWYGATALRQQQENERRKCGFTGDAWHSNTGEHMAWCASVGPDTWKAAAQERDRMLAQCASKG
jgi:hypothetical protein